MHDLSRLRYLKNIIDSFREITTVTLVKLIRLAPTSEVKEHNDRILGLEIERSLIQLTTRIIK
jgi:hypothetical protein